MSCPSTASPPRNRVRSRRETSFTDRLCRRVGVSRGSRLLAWPRAAGFTSIYDRGWKFQVGRPHGKQFGSLPNWLPRSSCSRRGRPGGGELADHAAASRRLLAGSEGLDLPCEQHARAHGAPHAGPFFEALRRGVAGYARSVARPTRGSPQSFAPTDSSRDSGGRRLSSCSGAWRG